MKESIIIKNFGPIVEVELEDIRPLTIFIGESGSGKSTVIKTLALFRWIFKMICIRTYLKESGISKSPFRFSFGSYLKNNGLESFVKDDTYIKYQFKDCVIEYRDKQLVPPQNVSMSDISLEKNSFISDKRNIIADMLSNKTAKSAAGYFLRETFDDYLLAAKEVRELNFDYLGVGLKIDKVSTGDKYSIVGIGEDNYKINLEDASSGTLTVTPLSLIIEYFSRRYNLVKSFNNAILNYLSNSDKLSDFKAITDVGQIENRRINIHIEEPELSLYPESQRSLMNFIINRCFTEKPSDYDMSVILATHSPYIINHINLLVLAAQKGVAEEGANIKLEDVNVYEIIGGYLNTLKQEDAFVIDTRPLSDPISNIYYRFEELKQQ